MKHSKGTNSNTNSSTNIRITSETVFSLHESKGKFGRANNMTRTPTLDHLISAALKALERSNYVVPEGGYANSN